MRCESCRDETRWRGHYKSESMEEAAANANKVKPVPKELLPERYSSPTQTPLKYEIKIGGSGTFDIELTDTV